MKTRSEFVKHITENRICLCVMLAAMLVLHGSMLFGRAIGIDTEALMYFGKDFYKGWYNSGRQGLVLVKYILMGGNFNPYLCGALTVVFMLAAGIAWTYLFRIASGRADRWGNIVFCLILASHTILTEQFYFRIQSAEISLGFAMTAASILIVYRQLLDCTGQKKKWQKAAAWAVVLVLNLITFSMYQVMIPLYIFGCVAVLYLHYVIKNTEPDLSENRGEAAEKDHAAKNTCASKNNPWLVSVIFAAVFIASFVLNELITLIFFNGSSYLNDQISWGSKPVGTCIYQIISHIARAGLLGRRIYFAPTYAVYIILLVILTIVTVKAFSKEKKADGSGRDTKRRISGSYKVYTAVLVLFIAMAPFYMTVVCGGEVVIRAQLVMPFTLAFMGYLLTLMADDCRKEHRLKANLCTVLSMLVIAVNVITIAEQSVYTLRLDHTDKVRYEQDEELALKLMEDIEEFQSDDDSLPVVFIGSRSFEPDSLCIKNGDVIGYSFFDWDTAPEPYSYHSSLRIIGFMSTLGTTYTEPDTAKMDEAYEYSLNMADYPEAGSIQICDGMIIVKLSDKE